MGDDVHQFAVPGLDADEAHAVAVRTCRWLVEAEIIEDLLTDSALGTTGAYRPGARVDTATATSRSDLQRVSACGVEFAIGREIAANFYEGYGGTTVHCRRCPGVYDIGDPALHATLDGLAGWLAGDQLPSFTCESCESCEKVQRIDDLRFDPPWVFAELSVNFWNWGTLRPGFVSAMLDRLPTGSRLLAIII